MATSVNGWALVPAGSPQLALLPGIPTGPVALAGPVAALLGYVAAEFHARVEAITSTSSHRPGATIGSTSLYSNHASATAVDLNGGRHPQYRRGTFTAAQVAQIRTILAATQVIDWGGDWNDASVDEMHFEIRPNTTAQQVADAAGTLNQEDDMTPEQAAQLTRIHDMIAVPGQPYGYPQAILNDIRAVARDVTTIQATLNVPGQPFAYPAATHNAVGGLVQRVTALQSAVAALSPSTGS